MQRFWGYLNLIWFGPLFILVMRIVGGYSCPEKAAIRRRLDAILEAHPGRPVLLCSNHLTMIDSMLLTWFLFDFKTLVLHFERFPWNVPELQNFGRNPLLRFMCYLGKCVYVERSGSTESRRLSWAKITYLHTQGEFICVFPEGGRSRSGRVATENAVYGVGQLVQDTPQTLVLTAYVRGIGQDQYSFFPKRGETFFLDLRVCPCPISPGRRGQKDITMSIMHSLEAMEQVYFATRQ